MNLNKAYKLSMVAMVVSLSAQVEAQTPYSLDDCRQLALANNVNIRNATNSVEAAKLERKEAFTKYFPTISATGMAFDATKGLVEMNMGALGKMSLLKDGVTGGITLSRPVFAGGQIINANKLAGVGVEINNLRKQQSSNEVRLTVEQYFWQVAVLKEKLSTLAAVDTMLRRLCSDVEASVNAGFTTRNDILQIKLKLNDTESRKSDLENNLSVCRMVLAQYIGLEGEADTKADVPTTGVPAFPQEIYRAPDAVLSLTPEYRLLENNVKANRLQQKMAVGKNLPTVAVGAGYMYDNLMEHSHSYGIAFVSVSIPLTDWWGGAHNIKKQKLKTTNAENTMNDSADLLTIRMQKAWHDLQNAHKQMLLSGSSIEQSAENLRLNENYYKAGTTTMSDLLDAQSMYQQSRDKFVEAYAQFRIKSTEYLIATGR